MQQRRGGDGAVGDRTRSPGWGGEAASWEDRGVSCAVPREGRGFGRGVGDGSAPSHLLVIAESLSLETMMRSTILSPRYPTFPYRIYPFPFHLRLLTDLPPLPRLLFMSNAFTKSSSRWPGPHVCPWAACSKSTSNMCAHRLLPKLSVPPPAQHGGQEGM